MVKERDLTELALGCTSIALPKALMFQNAALITKRETGPSATTQPFHLVFAGQWTMAGMKYDKPVGYGMSYFGGGDIPWEAQTENSRRKILRLEDDIYIAIIQWDAGFLLPHLDIHQGEETVYVLEGTFKDQGGTCGPGSIVRGDVGSSHIPGTDDGCTFFVTRSLAPGERDQIAPQWQRPKGSEIAV